MLLARAGEGSMRDSLSAFDQVRAFAGDTIAEDDVVTVLGLIGRDLVFDMLDAVVSEDAPAAFALVERAIERGYDLRLLCREIARAARDLLILSVDAKRASDPDVAGDNERERLLAMAGQWSREDLLRAFDLLTKAEQEIRISDQPRYNLEMALLRLMHLRKLVPLSDLLTGTNVPRVPKVSAAAPGGRSGETSPKLASNRASEGGPEVPKVAFSKPVPSSPRPVTPPPAPAPVAETTFKDRLLAEIKSAKATFYNLVVASAYRIDAVPSGVTFVFLPNQKNAKAQCEEQKAWLQQLAEKVAGRPVPVAVTTLEGPATSSPVPSPPPLLQKASPEQLKEEAMANSTVQAVLEIFPVEKTTIEER
jgi:DNA polymerase III subunit gamma/tau